MRSLFIALALLAPVAAQAQRPGCRMWDGHRICPPGYPGRVVAPNTFNPDAPITGRHPAPPVVGAPAAGTGQCRHYGNTVRCPPGVTE